MKKNCKENSLHNKSQFDWSLVCTQGWHGQEWHTLEEGAQVTYKLEVVLKLTYTSNQTFVVMDTLTHLMLAELHEWAGILLFSECSWVN